MTAPFNPSETQIQARMIAQAPHLTHVVARVALIKEHTVTQQAALRAAAPHTISSFDFFARIPDATWSKIRAASMANDELGTALHRGLLQLSAASTVIADNPDLLGMLTALVAAGILTADEKTQILGF